MTHIKSTGTGGRTGTIAREHAGRPLAVALAAALLIAHGAARAETAQIRVGSKPFTEGIVLGEVLVEIARQAGFAVEHRGALGGTQIVFAALERGEIDCYVEYSGTLEGEILRAESPRSPAAIARALARRGLARSGPLGFDNTYALGMKESEAERLGIEAISDLGGRDLVIGLSDEFVRRADGWPAVRAAYGLRQTPRVLEHALAYRGLDAGHVAVTDVYATDPEVRVHDLRLLRDDLDVFRGYEAFVLFRADLASRAPAFVSAVRRLEGAITADAVREMNARVRVDGVAEGRVAADYLATRFGWRPTAVEQSAAGRIARDLTRATVQHLALVAAALAAAIAFAVPLGIWAWRRPRLAPWILGTVGLMQTIPALAMLVVLVPLLGLGWKPAVVALFLYGLLPIVRGTHAGLAGIPPELRESAVVLGLDDRARLKLVELPLAAPAILSGIKTAAVITVGTTTIGGLIGAGGYGEAILAGIRRADTALLLEGAVPAAVLAVAIQAGCDLLDRRLVSAAQRSRG